jgi:hypothetical protein
MSSVAQRPQKPKVRGLLSPLLEVALSIGGYYLLRAFGVGVFWALTTPAIAVAVVVVVATVHRRRVDMIGLLVLFELGTTITLSLATQSPRVAALRETAYVLVAGVFCLVTLFYRTPLTHMSTSSMATFGDPIREKAFELAWRDVPRYRMWQRLLTASLGLIMVVSAITRAYIIYSAPDARMAHAIDVSNVVGTVMWVAVFVVPAILIQPARQIVQRLVERLRANAETRDRSATADG